ncbi:hypothetical protein Tco_0045099 [Tanacetum coccineum]
MSTYLKNMAGYKHNQLKNKSFDDIKKLFDKAMKRVNTFVDMDTELVEGSEVRAEGSETRVEGSSKRTGEELQQESSKKQKLEDDNETVELQRLIEVVPDKEEVAIDAIPLETKLSNIVDYKIHKEGKKTYYQIIRANGSSKMYLVFSHMLKSFDREDLETLSPTLHVVELERHGGSFNVTVWARMSYNHICLGGDDSQALIQELHVLVGSNGIRIESLAAKLPYHILLAV